MFAGSGSLLVAIAKFGGYCFGIDIDYPLLHGLTKPTKVGIKSRDKDESIRANFKQYDIEKYYLDVIVGDCSLPLWKENAIKFDCILTDPPYSIRESAVKIGPRKSSTYKIPEKFIDSHTPQKVIYNMFDLVKDLLNFSSFHLNLNGRLVFWYKHRFLSILII